MTIISKRAYSNRSATQQYLLGDDAEAAISHAMLDERPGRVPRRVPSADDHIPAVRRSISQLVGIPFTVHSSPTSRFRTQSRKLCAAQEQHRVDSRGTGHPLAVLVVESAGCRGDAEAPPGRELKHPGATALPQSPRGRGRGVGAEALRRRSHLRRLPPESCGHLQETGPKCQRGLTAVTGSSGGPDAENLKSLPLSLPGGALIEDERRRRCQTSSEMEEGDRGWIRE